MENGEVQVEIVNDETLVMVDDGPEGMHLIHDDGTGAYEYVELVGGQNPIAEAELPRNIADIYADDIIIKDSGPAAQLVFNIGNCVNMDRVCHEVPWCPPDRDSGCIVYVLSTTRIYHVLDLTNDGLSPWNSSQPMGRIKSSSRSVAVNFKEDGSLDLKDLTNCRKTDPPLDCVLKCYYARNPNEPNLVKRIYYAVNDRNEKKPREGTFAVISYQFNGPTRLLPRVHRNVRNHRGIFKRVKPSVANLIREKLRTMTPMQAREAVAKELDMPLEEIDMKAVHNLAKTVKDRVRAFPQGRRPYKDDVDYQPQKRIRQAVATPQNHYLIAEYGQEAEDVVDQKPMLIGYAPHHEEVIEDVAGPSEYSECPRYYDNVVVSEDSESLRLHPILLQGLESAEWDEMNQSAANMIVEKSRLNPHANSFYHVAVDIVDKKCFYVDVDSEPATCQCDFRERGLFLCAHILAVVCRRADGEAVLNKMAAYERTRSIDV